MAVNIDDMLGKLADEHSSKQTQPARGELIDNLEDISGTAINIRLSDALEALKSELESRGVVNENSIENRGYDEELTNSDGELEPLDFSIE